MDQYFRKRKKKKLFFGSTTAHPTDKDLEHEEGKCRSYIESLEQHQLLAWSRNCDYTSKMCCFHSRDLQANTSNS
jgi:hypothetical protein